MRQLCIALFLSLFGGLHAQPIDRQAVVSRHCPHTTSLDSLSSLTVGNGGFAYTVDATGLQTFPQIYAHGVPLGTMSNWGWHSFVNPEGFSPADVLVAHDFHRGRGQEWYAAQFKQPGRQHDAANYLRANPHRLHLGVIGLNLADASMVKDIDQRLDLWTGIIHSRFCYGTKRYEVQTLCDPAADRIAVAIKAGEAPVVRIRFPFPTGNHSDDAISWNGNFAHERHISMQTFAHKAVFHVTLDTTRYRLTLCWQGEASCQKRATGEWLLTAAGKELSLTAEFQPEYDTHVTPEATFDELAQASAGAWKRYWSQGGAVDFGRISDHRAAELERRVVLSRYLMATQEAGCIPPQETGLTYNSWFGKFHLEMTWWHLAHYALWGHPELLNRSLSWYCKAQLVARQIAQRQGFKGVRWMKMTDPSAMEAPSNVGSYLIWQQPHPIYLAELLYRASPESDRKKVLHRYADMVEQTANFMADFAEYDSMKQRYVLRGCIPAQETLKADSVLNPPFELSYWLTTLQMAQQWRQRLGRQSNAQWQAVVDKLSRLAFNADSLYLAAESATNTYADRKLTSDHPAVLGACGMMPQNRLVDAKIMAKTLDWIWQHWNWDETWGWDFPMMAMTCARLGQPSRAVDALLMPMRTNTYLTNGHNYQDGRLRVYMPGNGGLLTAVAMMCAGWDGSTQPHPGFPVDWDVRFEGLNKMP